MSDWISVEDRLPVVGAGESRINVICARLDGTVKELVCIRDADGTVPVRWEDTRGLRTKPPTHWMPMPEHPNKRKDG